MWIINIQNNDQMIIITFKLAIYINGVSSCT